MDNGMDELPSTLNELLRLSYPETFRWLSAVPEAEIPVHWVVTGTDEIQKGDLLLIPGTSLTPKNLKQAYKHQAAGIVVVGELPADLPSLPPNFPVLVMGVPTSLWEVQRSFLSFLVNKRAYLMEQGVRVQTKLSKLAVDSEDLEELTRAISNLCGRGVLVQDKRLGVMADYPSASLAAVWDDLLEQLVDISSLPKKLADRNKAGKRPLILRQTLPNGLERIVTPITVSGVARGYLSLIDIDQRLDSLDHLIAEQGALVVAIEMARAKAVREAEKRLKGDLLTALLQENITPRDANLWLHAMGLDSNQAHIAIRFSWDDPSPPSMRRLETLVNGEVSRRGLKVLVEILGSEVVCFCQVDPNTNLPEEALTLANSVSELAEGEYPEIPMRSGIGNPAGELSTWRDSFRQAGQALEMARRLQARRPRYFPDLSVYRLLVQLEHHPDLRSFKDEILGPLLNYEGGGDLITTLNVFFEHNGNLSQAAEALFIHRNTLIYRMERIAEITGLDLDNTETRLAVQLALHIHRMVKPG
jgi:purine catabolism regulator